MSKHVIMNKFYEFLMTEEIFSYTVIDMMTARKAGKSKAIALAFVFHAHNIPGLALLVSRAVSETMRSTIKAELDWAIKELNIPIKRNLTNLEYTFQNGNRLIFKGAKVSSHTMKTMLGFNVDYQPIQWLIWEEEATEYTKEDMALISEAIRGAPATFIRSSNPWFIDQWYVNSLDSIMAFDRDTLIRQNYQRIVVDNGKRLIIYATYKVNKLLPQPDIDRLLDEAKENPHRAETVLWGMPGVLTDTIYGALLPNVRLFENGEVPMEKMKYHEFTVGIDFGEISDSTSVVLLGADKNYHRIDVLETLEYKPTKRKRLERDEIAALVHNTIVKWMYKHNIKEIQARYDNSAVVFGKLLISHEGDTGIYYKPCSKKLIVQRIDLTLMLMAQNRTKWINDAKLYREMNQAMWVLDKRTGEYLKQRADGNDHMINAFEYALERRHRFLIQELL